MLSSPVFRFLSLLGGFFVAGSHRAKLPGGVEPLPALLQEAGYFARIGSGLEGLDHRPLSLKKPGYRRTKPFQKKLKAIANG
jgi:hypothetical protein